MKQREAGRNTASLVALKVIWNIKNLEGASFIWWGCRGPWGTIGKISAFSSFFSSSYCFSSFSPSTLSSSFFPCALPTAVALICLQGAAPTICFDDIKVVGIAAHWETSALVLYSCDSPWHYQRSASNNPLLLPLLSFSTTTKRLNHEVNAATVPLWMLALLNYYAKLPLPPLCWQNIGNWKYWTRSTKWLPLSFKPEDISKNMYNIYHGSAEI